MRIRNNDNRNNKVICIHLFIGGIFISCFNNDYKLQKFKKSKLVGVVDTFHNTTNYSIKENEMKEKNEKITTSFVPKYKIRGSEHFFVKGIREDFDMSAIVSIYAHILKNIDSIKRGIEQEFDIGRATIVFSLDKYDTIHLITGWTGNRKKTQRLQKENLCHVV